MNRIQGISNEFIPAIVKLDELDAVVSVADGDAILMAQKLAESLGLAVGISSGANFLGAVMIEQAMGRGAAVVTVLSGDNKKYLSTGLLRSETVKPGFLSPQVELLGFGAFKRFRHTCCDPVDCLAAVGPTPQVEMPQLPTYPRRLGRPVR